MAIIVPNSASTYTASAVVPKSNDRWAVLGFTPGVGASGSAAFWTGSAVSDGSPLLPVVCAAGQTFITTVVFNSPCNTIIVASVAGGSAFVWLKNASGA